MTTTNTFKVRIQRQDGRDQMPYIEEFDVAYKPNLNIISALQLVAATPVTSDGKTVTPVTWDCGCLEEVCGACTMIINGRVRQACSTLVDACLSESGDNSLTIEPMSKFPVVRDLFVDRQRMFENLKRIKGWVPIDSTADLGPGAKERPEKQDERYAISRCMTCGCCLEACPQFTKDNSFLGAQAIAQAYYFNEHPTGATLKDERMDVLIGEGGLHDCGNSQNCVQVCPKEIPLTEAIAKAGRQVTIHAVKSIFTSKH